MVCVADVVKVQRIIEEGRIFEFLAGLNSDFDQVCVQILEKESLPPCRRCLHMFRMRRVVTMPYYILPWLRHSNPKLKGIIGVIIGYCIPFSHSGH